MLRGLTLVVCCLSLGACGTSPGPRAAAAGTTGLAASDRSVMQRIGVGTRLYRETARTTRNLLANGDLTPETFAVRINAEVLRGQTIVERVEGDARELRDPALVRGVRKVIRLLREQTRQYELAGRSRVAGNPEAAAAASAEASLAATDADQTLSRLLKRFPGLPG